MNKKIKPGRNEHVCLIGETDKSRVNLRLWKKFLLSVQSSTFSSKLKFGK